MIYEGIQKRFLESGFLWNHGNHSSSHSLEFGIFGGAPWGLNWGLILKASGLVTLKGCLLMGFYCITDSR